MWERVNANEYNIDIYRAATLDMPYVEVAQALGEPHKNGEVDFPDDPKRVDVCWGFRRDDGARVAIWNFQNGPVYRRDGRSLESVDSFSVYYSTPKAWDDFQVEMLGRKKEHVERESAPLIKVRPVGVKIDGWDI